MARRCGIFSPSVAAAAVVVVVLALTCPVVLGGFTTGLEGCYGPTYFSLSILSAAENEAAAKYLRREGIPFAGLGGSVTRGVLGWDDGSRMAFVPPSFSPPPSASGFLILRSDGSWDYKPNSDYLSTRFICSDGMPDEESTSTSTSTSTVTSTTTTTTTADLSSTTTSTEALPPSNSTSTITTSTTTTTTSTEALPSTSTSTSTTTTTAEPPLPAVNLSSVVAALKDAFDAAASIDVAAFTANVVQLSAAASPLLEKVSRSSGTVYLGVGGCDATSRKAARVAALTASPATSKIGFYLPFDVAKSGKTTTYNLCLLGYNTAASSGNAMAPPERFAMLTAHLTVHSIGDVMTTLLGTVTVNYEDRMDGKGHTKPLVITGTGTATPYTTDLSPEAFRDITLSLINNGVNGRTCTPSSNNIPFLLVDNTLQLSLSSTFLQLITNGEKSVCASISENTAVVAAKLSEVSLAAVAPKQKYSYGTPIPARLHGVSTNSLAKGYVTAFLSGSSQCSQSGSTSALVEGILSTDVTASSAVAASAFVPQLFITAPPAAQGSAKYVCLSYKSPVSGSSATTFKLFTSASVSTSAPVQVTVAGASSKNRPTELLVFNGMEGTVALSEYVAVTSSASDQAHYDAVMSMIASKALQFVSFVPLRITAGTTQSEKVAACRKTGSAEVKSELQSGILLLTQSTVLTGTSGVLCINTEYIRVDYSVANPTTWLRTFGGTSDFSSSAFVLSATASSGDVSDVAPLTFAGPQDRSDIAIRLSSSHDCTMGSAAAVRRTDEGKMIAGLPNTGLGTYTICVGIFTSSEGVDQAAFVSTGRELSMAPYDIALSNWKAHMGITSGTWTSCGGAAACGSKTAAFAQEVCPTTMPGLAEPDSGAMVRTWPRRLEDAVNYLGAFEVQMGGNGALAPAGAFLGSVFTSRANAKAHCQQHSLLEMTTDGASYSTSVVATMSKPFVSFKPGSQLSGSIFGLAPWDQSCAESAVSLRVVLANNLFLTDSTKGETGNSTFDVSPLLHANREGYFIVCYSVNGAGAGGWSPVTLSNVKVIRDHLNDGVQVEAIGTGSPIDNQDHVQLWRTQSATWYVSGEFDLSVPVSLLLLWDDATCQAAAPAYVTPVTILSTTGGKVAIDASLITEPPADGLSHYLHPCYQTSLASKAKPLAFEAKRGRRIVLSALSLSSVNYLPHYAIAYDTPEDTAIQLTDPHKPPITKVALFRAATLVDPDEATAHCSTTSQNFIVTLSVTVDAFGMRWIVVPSWVARTVGSASEDVYLLMCATAAVATLPQFEPVTACITVNPEGVDTANDVYLDLTFAPLNLSTDVLEEVGALQALRAYITAVLPTIEGSQVLVSDHGLNHFALYIEPRTAESYTLSSPTASLYAELVAGTKLPLGAESTVNGSYFVLKSVEGRQLGTQSPHPGYPFAWLRTTPAATTVDNGTTTSIALFCIIVTPTVVGFVIFSVQRTIPALRRGGEAEAGAAEGDGGGGTGRAGKGPTVYTAAGDSPPPRNPRHEAPLEVADGYADDGSAKGFASPHTTVPTKMPKRVAPMELAVRPNAEDTAANPLYDDSDEDDEFDDTGPTGSRKRKGGADEGDLGCSPPLRNATFAMSGFKGPGDEAEHTKAARGPVGSDEDMR